MVLLKSRNV